MRNVTVQEEKKNGNEKILRADVISFDNYFCFGLSFVLFPFIRKTTL